MGLALSLDAGGLSRLRVVLDASVLLGGQRRYLVAGAELRYCAAFWSSWIVSEIVRKRTEWVAQRAAREGCGPAETTRRLRASRARVNALIEELSRTLQSVDYAQVPPEQFHWLRDPDDVPVMQTALAASADVLVTDNAADFPLGERRHGVLILGSGAFLALLFSHHPEAEADLRAYLGER